MSDRNLRISVDPTTCVGSGMCRDIAPETFHADASGQSIADNSASTPVELALEARDMCPSGAIAVINAATEEPVEG